MRLSEQVITKIKEPGVRRKLADSLNCTDQTIIRHIKENKDNGALTKLAALQIIRDETKMSDEQILEQESDEADANVIHQRA